MSERIHVAAAAIVNEDDEVLIARRPEHLHQGGLWEFPGGKLERGEEPEQALVRECHEELGVELGAMRRLIRVPYDYHDRSVLLDVWRVDAWDGEPHGAEHQAVRWAKIDSLNPDCFPLANAPIITALQLPPAYMVTPEPFTAPEHALSELAASLRLGARLVQLRSKRLQPLALQTWMREAVSLCKSYGARVLVNGEPGLVEPAQADGVHLSSERLMSASERPLPRPCLVSASCHDSHELRHAWRIGVDFAVLSPVRKTPSHPDAVVLGWERFQQLVWDVPIPVYALGGMRLEDLSHAWRHGAQGIAAIRAFSSAPAEARTQRSRY